MVGWSLVYLNELPAALNVGLGNRQMPSQSRTIVSEIIALHLQAVSQAGDRNTHRHVGQLDAALTLWPGTGRQALRKSEYWWPGAFLCETVIGDSPKTRSRGACSSAGNMDGFFGPSHLGGGPV